MPTCLHQKPLNYWNKNIATMRFSVRQGRGYNAFEIIKKKQQQLRFLNRNENVILFTGRRRLQ